MRIKDLTEATVNINESQKKIWIPVDQDEGTTGKISLANLTGNVFYGSQDVYLPTIIDVPDVATVHNSIYRGKCVDLTKALDSIQDGSFDDLYVGDYFEITMPTGAKTFTNTNVNTGVLAEGTTDTGSFTFEGAGEKRKFVFLGFDIYMGTGDSQSNYASASSLPTGHTFAFTTGRADMQVTKHHAVVAPLLPLFSFGMNLQDSSKHEHTDVCYNTTLKINNNDTATAAIATGYLGCRLRNSVFPQVKKELITAEPKLNGHILTYRELLGGNVLESTTSMWSGQKMPTLYYWTFSDLELLSEPEVYGTRVWGNAFDVGIAKQQLPYFKLAIAKENA